MLMDTLELNVYDSIFPYDNRVWVYNPEHDNPNKFIYVLEMAMGYFDKF
jgi:hypothetical protein